MFVLGFAGPQTFVFLYCFISPLAAFSQFQKARPFLFSAGSHPTQRSSFIYNLEATTPAVHCQNGRSR